MGLGKSLTIVSLIASTLGSARKFEIKPIECPDPATLDADATVPAIEANHFSGAVFGMPSTMTPPSEATKTRTLAIERYARMSRIKVKTRGTLIVCPLTTVSNWEDQLLEHWAGPVTIFTAGAGANEKGVKKNGRAEFKRKRGGSKKNGKGKKRSASNESSEGEESDEIVERKGSKGKKRSSKRSDDNDDYDEGGDDDDEIDTTDLRVYVYHGNHRNADPDYLADFDVVITTFSTLATEFSKQIRTGEEGASGASSAAGKGKGTGRKTKKQLQEEADEEAEAEAADDSDEVVELDDNGQYVTSASSSAPSSVTSTVVSKKRKRGTKGGAPSNLVAPNENEATSPLQQIEWFRVVLDEAQ